MRASEIKIELIRMGRSQADIARELGMTKQGVNRCVMGITAEPRVRRAIASACGMSYERVWGTTDPANDMSVTRSVDSSTDTRAAG